MHVEDTKKSSLKLNFLFNAMMNSNSKIVAHTSTNMFLNSPLFSLYMIAS